MHHYQHTVIIQHLYMQKQPFFKLSNETIKFCYHCMQTKPSEELFEIWIVGSADLHGHRLDSDSHSVLCPGVPLNVRVYGAVGFQETPVEIGHAALIKPPARFIVLSAAALHSRPINGAEWTAAVIVNIESTEGHRVLVVLLPVPSKCISYQKQSDRIEHTVYNNVNTTK